MRSTHAVAFSGSVLSIGGRTVRLDYPIQHAVALGDSVIVLYDPDAYQLKFGQFPNLEAFTPRGQKLWTAELPTTTTGDRYYELLSGDPLLAHSFSSFRCEIDPASGKIVQKTFLK